MFADTFWLTVLIILGISIFLMIMNRRTSDRCLKDFNGFLSTFVDRTGKRLWGRLKVYTTGLEFIYREERTDTKGHIESSSIIYKQEFPKMWMIVRFHDELTEKNQVRRLKQLKKSFHPRFYVRFARWFRNLVVSLKDALTDITSAVISSVSATSPAGKVISNQQKKLTQAQTELVGYTGTAYDPILERHIGQRVVIEIVNPSNISEEWVGILKEYSSDFIEIMGVNYKEEDKVRECDIIVPRSISFVRHSNEPGKPVKAPVKKPRKQ